MTIHKCDKCREEVSRVNALFLGVGLFSGGVVLCRVCAEPVIDFLQGEKLLEPQLIKAGFITNRAE